MPATFRIGERRLGVSEQVLRLSLRGRPPLALWRADLELRARDEAWEARLETASPLAVPLGPFVGAAAADLAIPLKDPAGTSYNVKLYVFEHAPVRDLRLRLDPLVPGRVRLRLSGRSDVWYAPHERDLEVEVDVELAVGEIRVDGASDEGEAVALVEAGGFSPPPGSVVGQRYGSWRIFLPQPPNEAKQS